MQLLMHESLHGVALVPMRYSPGRRIMLPTGPAHGPMRRWPRTVCLTAREAQPYPTS
jgi:hypothetical protein